MCHSNIEDNVQEEDCGPDGMCFFQDIMNEMTDTDKYLRGCDHVFMCELIKTTNSMPSNNLPTIPPTIKVNFTYCVPEVPYYGLTDERHDGTFCCCDEDYCNKDEEMEQNAVYSQIKLLSSGTKEDYDKLLQVAEVLKLNGTSRH
ncbi:unnamed protein product [Anisakis simplex]|uniref:Group XIIA secretory phospholipase A2 n=1 Tax=Anisakis simplex TaxID=6269 RepID=A0A0M3K4Z0_ANISI|nr:unnamed protein product [Anisakis simplex]